MLLGPKKHEKTKIKLWGGLAPLELLTLSCGWMAGTDAEGQTGAGCPYILVFKRLLEKLT